MPIKNKPTRSDIQDTVLKGRKFPGEIIELKASKQKDTYRKNFVLIVLKKTVRNIVKKNLLKRRVKHILAKHKNFTNPNLLYVFILKKGTSALAYKNLEKEILKKLKQCKNL